MTTVTMVVPCHNEARRLNVAEYRRFAAAHAGIRFLLVNDGSRDNTLELLDELAASAPRYFAVLNLMRNRGKAEAVRQGVLHAAGDRPDFIGYWDSDLATPLDAIPAFVNVLEHRPEISLVLGSRLPLLGHDIRRRPLRRWIGRAFARVASRVLGLRVFDTQCGAKLFRTTPEMLAAFAEPFGSRWIFDVELLARLRRLRRQASSSPLANVLYELPLERWEDVAGSRLKRSDFIKAIGDLWHIWWRYFRPGAPAYHALPTGSSIVRENADSHHRQAA